MIVEIGKDSFELEQLDGVESFLLQDVIAPPLAEVLGVVATMGSVSELGMADIGAIAPVVGRFFGCLPPEKLKRMMRALLANATMNGKPLFTDQGDPFRVLMRGRTLDTWTLLFHAIKLSYPDFFARLGGLGKPKAPAAPPSETSTT